MYVLSKIILDEQQVILVSKNKNKLIEYVTDGNESEWEINYDECYGEIFLSKITKNIFDEKEYIIEKVEEI